jgi:hypothetical protein
VCVLSFLATRGKKEILYGQVQWLKPIILAVREAEIVRTVSPNQLGQ